MSVFNVVSNIVANINNNQNNNNNNNNNLQINKISTQNTQITANTNNANTISIMLPPPIPVLGRGLKIDAKKRLKRFVERERKLELRRNGTLILGAAAGDNQSFILSAIPILRLMLDDDVDNDCLGRQLCHVSKDIPTLGSGVRVDYLETVALKTTLFGLLWVKLEDRSESFVEFLDRLVSHELDQELDCDLIFYQCSS